MHRVIADLHPINGVDPFLRRPVDRGMRYFRLHGKPAYHYHDRCTGAELPALRDGLSRARPNRVLFNNDSMADDAKRFMRLLDDPM